MTTVRASAAGVRRAVACALAAALLTGCAQSVDPIERLGRKAAQKVRHHPRPAVTGAPGAPAASPHAPAPGPASVPSLRPAPAPRPAAHRVFAPRARGAVPPVVTRVPTRDRVVFLTFDDDAGKDPRFVGLVRDLRLPVSVFLTHSVAGPGHDHFGQLRALGAGVENHTLTHPLLPGLGYVQQHAEICGQQTRLKGRFGTAPHLLRPPYGAYDANTLRAAGACGIEAIVVGHAYAEGDRLRPGDILHTPAGARLTETTKHLLHRIHTQHLTVAHLETYL
ncbi:polysaccharide deacetylase family protein [Streptomyces kunmingensis]|uniref:Polysaccharide deacetylase family protein n=1 Tax=Streptomyces kunmingensis TaxID=68225 RepID=A0ABU6C6N3_9ACTN|nr:polysaccharide deacetylase family protein [Streptomyces kunmingensis]MEB3959886.1 polysaccharide deacetylase family protein [Streptomyces kunmingensis]